VLLLLLQLQLLLLLLLQLQLLLLLLLLLQLLLRLLRLLLLLDCEQGGLLLLLLLGLLRRQRGGCRVGVGVKGEAQSRDCSSLGLIAQHLCVLRLKGLHVLLVPRHGMLFLRLREREGRGEDS
jgi:hypothetical protein